MNTEIHVVIGAGFGDEGKGLVTDYLTRGPETLVVRFNGGAQAGHTVVSPDGRRHVFHHVGSGSFRAAATFLSEDFVVNPWLWEREVQALGFVPSTTIDLNARITTPYDMLLNQEIEQRRGDNRHGSCGMGFYETILRSKVEAYDLRLRDLYQHDKLRSRLLAVANDYIPSRLQATGLQISAAFEERWRSSVLMNNFLESCSQFSRAVRPWSSNNKNSWAGENYSQVIFEGAQGLLLDQDHEFFPYVTPSKTGLPNVLKVVPLHSRLNVHYVLRTYLTRHGVGPFPSEVNSLSFLDDTNEPNDWQGRLRYGHLDVDLLAKAISNDLDAANGKATVNASLVVTHRDQHPLEQARVLARRLGLAIDLSFHGPCRDNVQLGYW